MGPVASGGNAEGKLEWEVRAVEIVSVENSSNSTNDIKVTLRIVNRCLEED